jgi:hypothetical protein
MIEQADDQISTHAKEYVASFVKSALYLAGRHMMLTADVCEVAYPATGAQDQRSVGLGFSRGELQSLALAVGGHRPEPGQSTLEQMQHALNQNKDGRTYKVYYRPQERGYEVYRAK